MRVRNAKACQVSLSRFGKQPTGEALLFETETVTIAPGETVEIEDEFLSSEGAQSFFADGTLVDVEAERNALLESDAQPAAGEGEQGGEGEPSGQEVDQTGDDSGTESDAQPARGRKRRGE